MKHPEIVRYQQKLEYLFKRTSVPSQDVELQAHWSRYLCVLVSGFLEVSVRAIYGEYTKGKAAPNIVNYVETQLDDFRNPSMGKILDLTRCFNETWASQLKNATDGELKDAVDSIVANRHRIAHGEDVGITYMRVRSYYESVLKVVQLISTQCST
jgi:hypothetical protein